MRLRDHERHTSKPAAFEAREEAGPERGALGVPDVDTKDFPTPLRGHARGDLDFPLRADS